MNSPQILKSYVFVLCLALFIATQNNTKAQSYSHFIKMGELLVTLENNISWDAVDKKWEGLREKWVADFQLLPKVEVHFAYRILGDGLQLLLENTHQIAINPSVQSNLSKWTSDARLHRNNLQKLVQLLLDYEQNLIPSATSAEWANLKIDWRKTCKKLLEESYPPFLDEHICLDLRELMEQSPKRLEEMKGEKHPKFKNHWISISNVRGSSQNIIKTEYNSKNEPIFTEYWAVLLDKTTNKETAIAAKLKMECDIDRCDSGPYFEKIMLSDARQHTFSNFTDNPEELAELSEVEAKIIWKNKEYKSEMDIQTKTVFNTDGSSSEKLVLVFRVYY